MFTVGDKVKISHTIGTEVIWNAEMRKYADKAIGTIVRGEPTNTVYGVSFAIPCGSATWNFATDCLELISPTKTKIPHPHADVIKAWADGADIQRYSITHDEWWTVTNPTWEVEGKYRVTPDPTKVTERVNIVFDDGKYHITDTNTTNYLLVTRLDDKIVSVELKS